MHGLAIASVLARPGGNVTCLAARGGTLVRYGSKLEDVVRRVPHYVDRILKGMKGAPPAELPFEPPSGFCAAVNQKTARALGLALPQAPPLQAGEAFE